MNCKTSNVCLGAGLLQGVGALARVEPTVSEIASIRLEEWHPLSILPCYLASVRVADGKSK
jgi:hypothetical protein